MKLNLSETVNAPIDRVFDLFADFPNASERIDGIERIEMMTEGPVDKGTRFRETRIMFGKETTEEMEVTRFVPNESYLVEAESCGAHFQSEYRFTSKGDSTLVEMEMTSHPVSLFAKLMSPLGFLMAGTMKKCMLDDMQQLKKYCENA